MFKKSLLIFILLLISSLYANDVYTITYSKDNNCTMTKNNKKIPLFDERFKVKEPKSSYTCGAIQKEQYNDCKVLSKKNLTAQYFGYGAYKFTNLIIAFRNPSPRINSSITIECTKELVK